MQVVLRDRRCRCRISTPRIDADNLYITVTARSLSPKIKIITRAGQQRSANAIRSSGADEVIIPEYEGGLMTGRMIQKYYPIHWPSTKRIGGGTKDVTGEPVTWYRRPTQHQIAAAQL